jgi:hypothetical protein
MGLLDELLRAGAVAGATAVGGPGAGVAVGAGVTALQQGSSTGKDSQGRRWCPGRPTAAQIESVRQRATPAELASIAAHYDAAYYQETGPFMSADPDEIGFRVMGNRDCKHSDPRGATEQTRLLALVRRYPPATPPPAATTTWTDPGLTGTPPIMTTGGIFGPTVSGGGGGGGVLQQQGGGTTVGAPQGLNTGLVLVIAVIGLAGVVLGSRRR